MDKEKERRQKHNIRSRKYRRSSKGKRTLAKYRKRPEVRERRRIQAQKYNRKPEVLPTTSARNETPPEQWPEKDETLHGESSKNKKQKSESKKNKSD